jgi:protocatechuate 3,4-dioxygenase beta subunit
MRTLSLLILALFLSSCTLGSQPLSFQTATSRPATSAPLGQTAIVPTTGAASAATQSSAAAASDPFAANFLLLPAPDCSISTQTEGPYYKAGSPESNILYQEGMPGEKLIVAGYVLDKDCQPVPGAWLDFWQADANGAYDNSGFTLRGHQLTDAQGRYFLETVLPGEYPGRTEHIHVKVQPPNGAILTSQLYFPNVAANSSDNIYDPALLVTLEAREGFYVAYYNFVLSQ